VHSVACGEQHTLALTATGAVYSFGGGRRGALGHGATSDVLSPRRIDGLASVRAASVAAGAFHSLVVSRDGDLFTFGSDEHGQLGRGDDAGGGRPDGSSRSSAGSGAARRLTPAQVALAGDQAGGKVASAAGGRSHSLAVLRGGRLLAFGCGEAGSPACGEQHWTRVALHETAFARPDVATACPQRAHSVPTGRLGFGDLEAEYEFFLLPHARLHSAWLGRVHCTRAPLFPL